MLSKSRLLRLIQDCQTAAVMLENIYKDELSAAKIEKKVGEVIKKVDKLSNQLKKSINYHS